jgi:hypothetical protein
MEVVDKADLAGSTSYIIKQVEAAPPGTTWAIGTEMHLVKRLEQQHPEQTIRFLSPVVCMCATMYRIDLAHLCWSLEHVEAGNPVNVIRVDDETAKWAVAALEDLGPPSAADIPTLIKLVDSTDPLAAYWAITLLGRSGKNAAEAVAVLVACVESSADLSVRQRAAWALGKIGPAAAAARSTLKRAAGQGDERLVRLANEALEAIGG